jgi:hypothetical protein
MRVHGIELFGLVLGNFKHLHGNDTEAVLLELFNDVADRIALDRVGFTMVSVRCRVFIIRSS